MLTHITYEEKIKRGAKELYETDPKQVMKYGWKQWDDILGGIFGGELILLGGDSGSGKAQPLYSKILTPTGFSTIGKIQKGDIVVGADGKHKRVLGIPFEGIDDIYEIHFSDGTSVLASGNHLFKVTERTLGSRFKNNVVSVNKIKDNLKLQNKRNCFKYSIENCKPIEFKRSEHTLPPYTLGVLLGDGSLHYDSITVRFTNGEEDVVNRVRKELPLGMGITIGKRGNDIYITGGKTYDTYIRESGLYGKLSYDKFIPKEYIYDSIENRLQLLRGLMDTDGYIETHKNRPNSFSYTYSTVSEKLKNNFCELIMSLGGRPYVTTKIPSYTLKDGTKKKGHIAYTIFFMLPNGIIPISSKKHLSKHFEYKNKKNRVMIVDIKYIGKQECKCISVEDELYITDNYIVTHNSTIINQICINVANQGFRVVKYSLENRLENAAKEELFYTCNRIRKRSGRQPYKRGPFISNEYGEKGKLYDKDFKVIMTEAYRQLSKIPVVELDKDQNVAIEDIVKLIESEVNNGTKLFVIDHLHYFVFDDVERLDLQIKNVMHQLNELARKYNIAIIMVAHYRNNTGREKGRDMKPNPTYFRDSSSLKQIAHKIIQLVREEDPNDYEKEITIFYFTKFRGPVQNLAIYGSFNQDLYEYEFGEPSIEIKKQEIVNSVPFAIDEDEKPF